MTEEEKEEEVDSLRQKMGMLPKAVSMTSKKSVKPKVPYKIIYESDTTKETELTDQAAAPSPGEPIEIGDDNDNYGWSQDQQECENDPDNQLFSTKSDDDNDDIDPFTTLTEIGRASLQS